jgi:hypothetical protein
VGDEDGGVRESSESLAEPLIARRAGSDVRDDEAA